MSQEYEYKIEYKYEKESNQIIGVIPELNHVSSFGKTFAEAETNTKEAALCYLESLIKSKQEIPKPAFTTEGTYLKLFIPHFEYQYDKVNSINT